MDGQIVLVLEAMGEIEREGRIESKVIHPFPFEGYLDPDFYVLPTEITDRIKKMSVAEKEEILKLAAEIQEAETEALRRSRLVENRWWRASHGRSALMEAVATSKARAAESWEKEGWEKVALLTRRLFSLVVGTN